MLQKDGEVLQVGFTLQLTEQLKKRQEKETPSKSGIGEKINNMLAPIRTVKYSIAKTLADLMPDVGSAFEDMSLSGLLKNNEDDEIDYDGTMIIKYDRGFCPSELEMDFSNPYMGNLSCFVVITDH